MSGTEGVLSRQCHLQTPIQLDARGCSVCCALGSRVGEAGLCALSRSTMDKVKGEAWCLGNMPSDQLGRGGGQGRFSEEGDLYAGSWRQSAHCSGEEQRQGVGADAKRQRRPGQGGAAAVSVWPEPQWRAGGQVQERWSPGPGATWGLTFPGLA